MPEARHSAQPTTCTSCGSSDEDLVAVHRVYVAPAAWDTPSDHPATDTPRRVDVVDEVEWWCFPCRTHYPHQLIQVDRTPDDRV